jgi:hypothetical protein
VVFAVLALAPAYAAVWVASRGLHLDVRSFSVALRPLTAAQWTAFLGYLVPSLVAVTLMQVVHRAILAGRYSERSAGLLAGALAGAPVWAFLIVQVAWLLAGRMPPSGQSTQVMVRLAVILPACGILTWAAARHGRAAAGRLVAAALVTWIFAGNHAIDWPLTR